MAWGRAEPPIMTFQPDRSVSLARAWLSSMCRMVGTQWEKVTRSRAFNRNSTSGW